MPKRNGPPKVRFNLSDRQSVEAYIFAYFHYNEGQRLKYSAGEKILSHFWDDKAQRVKLDKKNPHHSEINLHLNRLELTILEIYRDFNNGEISPADFRNEVDYRMGYKKRPAPKVDVVKEDAPPLMAFIPQFIERKKSQPRGTWKLLQTVFGLMQSYAKERGKALEYDNIDLVFLHDFKNWLYAPPRLHSINYAAKSISIIRQFMRAAQDEKFHSNTTYLDRKFKIGKIKVSKVALSFEELERLYNLDLSDNPRLEKVRDLFLIGSYTGLRFSDFTRIRPDHIEVVDGKTLLNITTQKTGSIVSIPLLSIPLEMLSKYNFRAPSISNQKMNEYLKEIGKLAGMTDKMVLTGSVGGQRIDKTSEKWEKLSSHVARRSFATNFYRLGVPAIVLMKITGHTTERQFLDYISISGKENALHFADLAKAK